MINRLLIYGCLSVLLWRTFNPVEAWHGRTGINQSFDETTTGVREEHMTRLVNGKYQEFKEINPCKGMEVPRRFDKPELDAVDCWDSGKQAFVRFSVKQQ